MNGYVIPHFGLQRQYELLKDELLDVTDNVLKSGQFIEGYYTLELEKWLTARTGTYALTCHSGTQALELVALYLLERFSNPKAAVPNITYPATANGFITTGYDIELVDTNEFGIINPEKISTNVDVMVVVGLYGLDPYNYIKHNKLPTKSKYIVYDGAQHWLSLTKASSYGFATTISFDPTKNLPASGNGGAILTLDIGFLDFVKNFRSNGRPLFKTVGTNSKMSEIDCAHVLVRSRYIDEWQIKRRKIAKYWNDKFKNLPIKTMCNLNDAHAIQKYTIYTSDRTALRNTLTVAGIDTRINYDRTLNEMMAYKHYSNPSAFSTSFMLTKGVLSLPIYPELYDNEVEYIAETIIKFYQDSSQ